MGMIDFDGINARLLPRLKTLLPEWIPGGRFVGDEYVAGSAEGGSGRSFSINCTTGRGGDFATEDVRFGDPIGAYMAIKHLPSRVAAARELEGVAGSGPAPAQLKSRPVRRAVVMPVPKDAPQCKCFDKKLGDPVHVWDYRDRDGNLIGHVARYEPAGERKQYKPWTFGSYGGEAPRWERGRWPLPMPLYGLDDLAQRPDAPVMIVEGEKAADAARTLGTPYVVVTWPGGSPAAKDADLSPLKGRTKVLLIPDCDEPGVKAMRTIGRELVRYCREVKMVMVEGKPQGWDIADHVEEGGTWETFKEWAVPLLQTLNGNRGKSDDGHYDTEGEPSKAPAENVTTPDSPAGTGSVDAGQRRVRERKNGGGDRGSSAGHDRGLQDREHRNGNFAARQGNSEVEGNPNATTDGIAAHANIGKTPPTGNGNGVVPRRSEGRHEAAPQAVLSAQRHSAPSGHPVAPLADLLDERVPATSTKDPANYATSWYKWDLDKNGRGVPRNNLNNAVTILQKDPAFVDHVWYDTFLVRIMTRGVDGVPREWQEADDIHLALDIQRRHRIATMSPELVSKAVIEVAMRSLKNCLRDWLSSLKWDGEPRIEHFFEDHFGAPATEYTRAVSKNFFLSLVARAYMPGCQADNMVVLEGAQGVFKSQCLKVIGGQWFTKQHESVMDPKAFAEVLQGAWLVEIDEMSSFKRAAELSSIKSAITTQEDNFRPSYGRYAKKHPRQCIFVGTTNETDWNKDDTGEARRFWPITCVGVIDIDAIAAGRDQLLAEAVSRLHSVPLGAPPHERMRTGSDWWTTPVEATKVEQLKRYAPDPWTEPIAEFVAARTSVTTNQILVELLNLKLSDVTKSKEMQVARCLTFLGWKKRLERVDGKTMRLWRRVDE